MPEARKRLFLTFPQEVIREPIVYNIGHDFNVITNIHGASVSDTIGLVALELVGEADEIERAVAYMLSRSVKIEPLEDQL